VVSQSVEDEPTEDLVLATAVELADKDDAGEKIQRVDLV